MKILSCVLFIVYLLCNSICVTGLDISNGTIYHMNLMYGYDLYWEVIMAPYSSFPTNVDGWVHFKLVSNGTGWFGFGINPAGPNLMSSADIFVTVPSRLEVQDYHSIGKKKPILDVSGGGVDNLEEKSVRVEDGVTFVEFKRKFETGDLKDNPIRWGDNKFIWARNLVAGSEPTFMPPNRGYGVINFFTGNLNSTGSYQNNSTITGPISEMTNFIANNLKYIHGGFMSITWGLINVVGFIVARYFRRQKWWFTAHRLIMTVGTTGTFSMLLASLSFITESIALTHLILGGTVAFVTACQIFFGSYSVYSYMEERGWFHILSSKIHRNLGKILLVISFAQIFVGISRLGLVDYWIYGFAGYTALVLCILSLFEYYRYRRIQLIRKRVQGIREQLKRKIQSEHKMSEGFDKTLPLPVSSIHENLGSGGVGILRASVSATATSPSSSAVFNGSKIKGDKFLPRSDTPRIIQDELDEVLRNRNSKFTEHLKLDTWN